MAKRELTLAEETFINEYMTNGFVKIRAYMVAFPESSYKASGASAYRLFDKPHIKEAVAERLAQEMGDANELASKALIKLQAIAFAEKGDPDYGTMAQLRALELIQKQLGLQIQNIKAKVEASTNVEINILGEEDGD